MHPTRARSVVRRWLLCAAAVLNVLYAAGAEAADTSSPTYRKHKGQIVYQSDKEFPPIESEKSFAATVAKAKKNKTLTADASGDWNFYFIAFLRQPSPVKQVNLVWYSLKKKKAEQFDYVELTVPPNEVTLQSKAVLRSAQGFKGGESYEARITRLVGKKEIVLAKTRVTLKGGGRAEKDSDDKTPQPTKKPSKKPAKKAPEDKGGDDDYAD